MLVFAVVFLMQFLCVFSLSGLGFFVSGVLLQFSVVLVVFCWPFFCGGFGFSCCFGLVFLAFFDVLLCGFCLGFLSLCVFRAGFFSLCVLCVFFLCFLSLAFCSWFLVGEA